MDDPVDQLSFEDALKRLEAIVARLESGDASLQESIDLYAEGDKLRRQCEERLAAATARIEAIRTDASGKAGTLGSRRATSAGMGKSPDEVLRIMRRL